MKNETRQVKILLTGGLGFIGSRLYKKLTNQSKDGVVVYDLKNGEDIRDRIKLDKLFEQHNFDVVIHLAALAGVRRSKDFPDEYITTNITGTYNLIEACKKYNVKNFIFFSSSSVLGGCDGVKGLSEANEYNPRSLYATTKVAGELLIKNSGLNYQVIRPFTVYGESGRPDMVIYRWLNQIKSGKNITVFGDTNNSRGYTYVGDLVDGVVYLMVGLLSNCGEFKNITIHLGGAEVITLEELINIFDKELHKLKIKATLDNQDMKVGDVKHSFADTEFAFNLIGWNPSPSFKEMLSKIIRSELK